MHEFTETEVWAARLTTPDGERYADQGDREFAEFTADSVATHLQAVAEGRDTPARGGPEVTAVAVVRRTRRLFPDGEEHLSAWEHVRDGKPVEE